VTLGAGDFGRGDRHAHIFLLVDELAGRREYMRFGAAASIGINEKAARCEIPSRILREYITKDLPTQPPPAASRSHQAIVAL
jgi:hypothetical protein